MQVKLLSKPKQTRRPIGPATLEKVEAEMDLLVLAVTTLPRKKITWESTLRGTLRE